MRFLILGTALFSLSGCDLLLQVSSAALFDSPGDDRNDHDEYEGKPRKPSRDACLDSIPNDPGTAAAEREIIEYCEERGL